MKYAKEEIEIFKRVLADYKELKKEIDKRIKKGYDIEELLRYIEHLNSCEITNVDLTSNFKYIDFNYCDMVCSIIECEKDNIPLKLQETVEVWNDKEDCYIIEDWLSMNEIEKTIKEGYM